MSKFRKKPVVVEAVQITGISINAAGKWDAEFGQPLPDWMREAIRLGDDKRQGGIWPAIERFHDTGDRMMLIGTLESPHEAQIGDWIIRGVAGEIYPCKPVIFASTYDPAD